MAISATQRITVPPDVLANVIDGETVLLNLKNECYYGLDQVGTRMWQVLTESASVEAACEALQAEYDVSREELAQDLQELLGKLVEQGLVDVVDGQVA
jgi:hypothetical protein